MTNYAVLPTLQDVIKSDLDGLASLEEQRQHLRDAALASPEAMQIVQLYEKLHAAIELSTQDLTNNIAEVRAAIQSNVLTYGASVHSERYTAIWRKGRVSYDSKIVEGYILAHPELAAARRVGEPSVSIVVNGRRSDG